MKHKDHVCSWLIFTSEPPSHIIPIRNLTWNIVPKNHGPASQDRGAPAREMVSFLGTTDLGTRSVLERISIQNHFFESESV